MIIIIIGEVYQNKDFFLIAKDIIRSSEFQRRKDFLHHSDSVYEHSLEVAIVSYKMANKIKRIFPLSIEDTVYGALLHDFYTSPWRENPDGEKLKLHGFKHAKVACNNASYIFPEYMNKKVENIIKRHMFPLNIIPPKYIEGWIVTIADKYVSLNVFSRPKELPGYLGIKVPALREKSKLVYKFTKKFVANMY